MSDSIRTPLPTSFVQNLVSFCNIGGFTLNIGRRSIDCWSWEDITTDLPCLTITCFYQNLSVYGKVENPSYSIVYKKRMRIPVVVSTYELKAVFSSSLKREGMGDH